MAQILKTSQLTFVDITDQRRLSVYLTSNLTTIQLYDPQAHAYNPSWDTTNLILTPEVALDQKAVDLSSENLKIEWRRRVNNSEDKSKLENDKDVLGTNLVAGESVTDKTLAVNTNVLEGNSMITYICYITYTDTETGSTVECSNQMTFTLMETSKDAIVFDIIPEDTAFHNQEGEIIINALVRRGFDDITNQCTFTWYKYENTTDLTDDNYVQVGTGNTYAAQGADVINIQTYKCTAVFEDQSYDDYVTLSDFTDTYVTQINTIGGTVFKNGVGGAAAYAIVYANGAEVDPIPGYIGPNEPANTKDGKYWYKTDDKDDRVVCMEYKAGKWQELATAIPQDFVYEWSLMNQDGTAASFTATGKVVYLSCSDITDIGVLQCDVFKNE